jgi:hypothetical protein
MTLSDVHGCTNAARGMDAGSVHWAEQGWPEGAKPGMASSRDRGRMPRERDPVAREGRREPRSGVIIRARVLGTFALSKVPRPRVREPAMNGSGEAALNQALDSGFRRNDGVAAKAQIGLQWNYSALFMRVS